jgi:hypothetical protein
LACTICSIVLNNWWSSLANLFCIVNRFDFSVGVSKPFSTLNNSECNLMFLTYNESRVKNNEIGTFTHLKRMGSRACEEHIIWLCKKIEEWELESKWFYKHLINFWSFNWLIMITWYGIKIPFCYRACNSIKTIARSTTR